LEKVYFFGGSAAWGLGARDDYTIPSYLSKMLNRPDARFQVFNYSVPGYTFMQSILHLMLRLKEGHSPRYVIFYDGFNEIYAAHQHGIAGTVHNQFMTRERLKLKYREVIWNGIKEAFRKYCMIYKSINGLYMSINKEPIYQEVAEKYSDDQLRSLARDVVDDYKKSIKLLDSLSRAYDFKYICFWQPSMLTEHHLTKEESNIDIRAQDRAFKKLSVYVDEYLRKEDIPHFYLLTNALDKRSQSIYVDVAHLSEKGNEIIANNIYKHLQKDFFSHNRVNRDSKAAINPEPGIVVFPGAAGGPERQARLRQWRRQAGLINN
jgi:lysophospholipase L1-like esterase